MGICVLGSLNYDLVTVTDCIPNEGETVAASGFSTHCGGKGLNQAIAARLLGQQTVRMAGCVGDDNFGRELLQFLNHKGVLTSDVQVKKNVVTGTATILVEQNTGQNRILVVAGANGRSTFGATLLDSMFQPDSKEYVIFQNEIPDSLLPMRWIRDNRPGIRIVYNPSPLRRLKLSDIGLVDILVVNEHEAQVVLNYVADRSIVEKFQDTLKENFIGAFKLACHWLCFNALHEGLDQACVVTLGAQGVVFCSGKDSEVRFRPSIQGIKVVDTTGAGDTFLGGLVANLDNGSKLTDAINFATYSSSIAIQAEGAAESVPSRDEVMDFMTS